MKDKTLDEKLERLTELKAQSEDVEQDFKKHISEVEEEIQAHLDSRKIEKTLRNEDWAEKEKEVLKKIVGCHWVLQNSDNNPFYHKPYYETPDTLYSFDKINDELKSKNPNGGNLFYDAEETLEKIRKVYALFDGTLKIKDSNKTKLEKLLKENSELIQKVIDKLKEDEQKVLNVMHDWEDEYIERIKFSNNAHTCPHGICGTCFYWLTHNYRDVATNKNISKENRIKAGIKLINFYNTTKPEHLESLEKITINEKFIEEVRKFAKNRVKRYYECKMSKYAN